MTESAPKNNHTPILFAIIVMVIVAAAFSLNSSKVQTDTCSEGSMYATEHNVKLSEHSNKKYKIELATTPSKQELGLSDRSCLPSDGAMIFSFATDDKFGMWMKNMKFSIDVIWLDKDKKIVTIENNMMPESYPKVYYPTADARYVIELNSGDAAALKLAVGQTLHW